MNSGRLDEFRRLEHSNHSYELLTAILEINKSILEQNAEILKGLAQPVWIVGPEKADADGR